MGGVYHTRTPKMAGGGGGVGWVSTLPLPPARAPPRSPAWPMGKRGRSPPRPKRASPPTHLQPLPFTSSRRRSPPASARTQPTPLQPARPAAIRSAEGWGGQSRDPPAALPANRRATPLPSRRRSHAPRAVGGRTGP